MTIEFALLIAIAAAEIVSFVVLGGMLYRMWRHSEALGAATFLQGRKLESILREMRAELSDYRPGD
jgi:hypothetical protein